VSARLLWEDIWNHVFSRLTVIKRVVRSPNRRRSLQFYSRDYELDDTRCIYTCGCEWENKSFSSLFLLSLPLFSFSISVSRARELDVAEGRWTIRDIRICDLDSDQSFFWFFLIFYPLFPFLRTFFRLFRNVVLFRNRFKIKYKFAWHFFDKDNLDDLDDGEK